MIRMLLATTALFLSASAIAQTGPCSAGIQDPPIFSLVVSNPVRLSFKSTTRYPLSRPFVTIEGNAFRVVQFAPDFEVASPLCNDQSVSIGDLAPGPYSVTWEYREDIGDSLIASFTFAFTVPEASPCIVGVSIQPQPPGIGQPVSIVYATSFRGFLETPAVVFAGSQITIDQQAVIADPAFSGHVPCAQGIVQIGALQAGYYTVTVHSTTFGPFSDAFTVRQPVRSRAVRGH